MAKRMQDKIGIDLRIAARGKDKERAAEAEAELRRRVGNLRGGVIPEWEKRDRGPDPSNWAVV
jgi:hypothetical protein